MNIDIFSIYIKTDDIYKDIAEDTKTSFDTSNYINTSNQIDHCLKEKIKK